MTVELVEARNGNIGHGSEGGLAEAMDATRAKPCLLYTSDAADERSSVDLGGRRIIKKKKHRAQRSQRCVRDETQHEAQHEQYRQKR